MSKRVVIGPKPGAGPAAQGAAEEWVSSRQGPGGPIEAAAGSGAGAAGEGPKMKRLTIDIPEALHTRVKTRCAARGLKMTDEIRALLEERFGGELADRPQPEARKKGRGTP